jgi:hypothetical protein
MSLVENRTLSAKEDRVSLCLTMFTLSPRRFDSYDGHGLDQYLF